MAKFLSLNANGLRDGNKRVGLLHWLSHFAADFVCLQEAHVLSAEECVSWFSSYGYLAVASPGSARSCGTVVLYRSTYSLRNFWTDDHGRFVLAEFECRGNVFRLASFYAPNRNPERDAFLLDCVDKIDPSVPTVVCGDFNTVFDRVLDRRGSDPFDASRESSQVLSALFRDCCVVDVWRLHNPSLSAFSWTSPDGSRASRIDLLGCPYSWLHSVTSVDILPCPFSDHSAVSMDVSIPEPFPKGPGRWTLNKSVLKSDDFLAVVSSFWADWRGRKTAFRSLQQWWDVGKSRIKGLAVKFCAEKKAEKDQSRCLLENLAKHLKAQVDGGRVSLFRVYLSVLSQLAKLDQEAVEGARVRSRVRWAEEGEASSAFFFRLERKRGAESWISAMQKADGSITADISGICDSWVDFYSTLFTSTDIDLGVQGDLLSKLSRTVPASDVQLCEGPISVGEAYAALVGMAHGKAPGLDGLPMEFYVSLWDVLGTDLVDVLNESFASGLLPFSQRSALISLIFKKGDRLQHKNWRPISLLNVDYKLCARVLAGRLLKVIHHVVAPDQTCGVPGRFIGENVALLRDLTVLAADFHLPVCILSLDQEKAFDRVDWPFLFAVLSRMGFGPSFIKWVKLLYTDVRSSVFVNGYVSSAFKPSRGVRQGCPLSPLLYVLTMEVLAANIRSHPSIVPLSLPVLNTCLPVLSLYADDTSVISTSDASTCAVFDVYGSFEKGSGAKLNLDKCEGLWLGSWCGRSDAPVAIRWTSIMIKILGVFVGNGDLGEANWRPRIDAVQKCLDSWRSRSLSYRGRALVINALALSRVWYVASLVPMPPWALRELNTIIFKFFWGGKRDLVARDVLVHSQEEGGFGVVSIPFKVSALLAQWVRRFSLSPSGWVSLLTFWCFDRFGIDPLAAFSDPSCLHLASLPPFYASVLAAWGALQGRLSSGGLVVGSASVSVSNISCKSCYSLLLSLHPSQPHCVIKFRPSFGALDWPFVWKSLCFMPLDRKVIDLNWRVAHGVLYTAERLISFGLNVPAPCFCGYHLESSEHLFFSCPLAQSGIDWIQSLLFRASPLAPPLTVRHLLFGFSGDELRCVPRVFSYLLNVCKFFIWTQRNDFRFRSSPPSAVQLVAGMKSRVSFYLPLFFKRFRSARRKRYFLRQWGANGSLGFISGDSFKVRF